MSNPEAKQNIHTHYLNKRRRINKIIKATVFSSAFAIVSIASIVISVTNKNENYLNETINEIKKYQNPEWNAFLGLSVDQAITLQTHKSNYQFKVLDNYNDYYQFSQHWKSYDVNPEIHIQGVQKRLNNQFSPNFFEKHNLLVLVYDQPDQYYLLNVYDQESNVLNFYYLNYQGLYNTTNSKRYLDYQITIDEKTHNHIAMVFLSVEKHADYQVDFHEIKWSNELKRFYKQKKAIMQK
ncbi:hypothetical protein OF376_00525 [Ureaplasma miroungigenitalium]|uniref:Uncharacterized protein n=1 Tax=Ureaplasma miroungigenitalium TaxID=1042321 RepID=A0ABT3BLY8_9BACT|nr:hypothetical protein [Ureaplasma miroungigenitalium]MCV3728273.1 hypothetical protein [Ureaplasma miroungigenitalium]MCV3734078.1 hypothetical protein [Ureaplasma miroungigenitalium]